MDTRDPRVDGYIDRAADFAKPILRSIRETVHAACPEVEETLRWNSPTFFYHGILCGMAAFKQHCVFGFWKGALIKGPNGKTANEVPRYGRITRLSDLPSPRLLRGYLKQAMALNEAGIKVARPKASPKKPIPVPADLRTALRRNPRARATFEGFSPTHRREYLEWITGAKAAATRERRLATAVQWISEGKTRNWKYM